jgi:hypothetical protein
MCVADCPFRVINKMKALASINVGKSINCVEACQYVSGKFWPNSSGACSIAGRQGATVTQRRSLGSFDVSRHGPVILLGLLDYTFATLSDLLQKRREGLALIQHR